MNGLIKRMCILKQLKTGFSADGNALSGIVRIERYGKLCNVNVSLINFAPLSLGRYVCVLCDKQGERLVFCLTAKSGEYRAENCLFNPEKGFCALICFVKNPVVEGLAAGQYGGGGYNLKLLLEGLAQPEKTKQPEEEATAVEKRAEETAEIENTFKFPERKIEIVKAQKYDDEAISQTDYYAEEKASEERAFTQNFEDEDVGCASEETKTDGPGIEKNAQDKDVLHPFKISQGQSYYLSIKDELEALFSCGERIEDLKIVIPNSEWVRVKDAGDCLVGVIYENLTVRYIAYALPANTKTPPEELKEACFVPIDPLADDENGYFILFQDADTGECVKISDS